MLLELLGPFAFGVGAFTVLMVAGSLLFKIADLVIQRGVSLGVVVRLFIYYLPGVVVTTIPMGSLLGALMGFGKLAAHSEVVALKACGVPFSRMVRPVVLAAVLASILTFVLNETVVPLSERAARNVLVYEVFRERPPEFKERMFLREEGSQGLKRVIYMDRIRPKGGLMEGVLVQEFDAGRLARFVSAPRARWGGGKWTLEDGKVFQVGQDGGIKFLYSFKRESLRLDVEPSKVEAQSSEPNQMTVFEIAEQVGLMEKQGVDPVKLRVMMHLRLAVPWASLVLAVVGASAGVRPQRSGSAGVGLGLSVVIVFLYYVVLSFCQSLGEASYMPAVVSAWVPNLLFGAAGLWMVRRGD
ncbi:LptF/LptG family permease [Thermanaerovibrio velox]|uniref:LptF/LptG family permease n=1 Tax=Thermanaerovibrio velox TaxID=108007 RepID=UPI001FDF872F|nr:LptF/LptG family permease [Thermanaerovibrio velox]